MSGRSFLIFLGDDVKSLKVSHLVVCQEQRVTPNQSEKQSLQARTAQQLSFNKLLMNEGKLMDSLSRVYGESNYNRLPPRACDWQHRFQ